MPPSAATSQYMLLGGAAASLMCGDLGADCGDECAAVGWPPVPATSAPPAMAATPAPATPARAQKPSRRFPDPDSSDVNLPAISSMPSVGGRSSPRPLRFLGPPLS